MELYALEQTKSLELDGGILHASGAIGFAQVHLYLVQDVP